MTPSVKAFGDGLIVILAMVGGVVVVLVVLVIVLVVLGVEPTDFKERCVLAGGLPVTHEDAGNLCVDVGELIVLPSDPPR